MKVDALLATETGFKPDPDIIDISLEVMSIVGSLITSITHETNVFYDSEILAIIHRSKTKSSGLVGTKVWGWYGAKSKAGEREGRKLQELAWRYNTPLVRDGYVHRSSVVLMVFSGDSQAVCGAC